MAKKILVFVESRDGAVKSSSLEAVAEASRLGAETAAVLVGPGVSEKVSDVAALGAGKVFLCEDERLALYCAEGYAAVTAAAARAFEAEAVFLSATAMGRDLGPSVAALFDTGVATDCTAIRVEGDAFVLRRPVYGGRAFAEVKYNRAPVICSLRPNAFGAGEPDASRQAETETIALDLPDEKLLSRVAGVEQAAQGKLELTEASRVVTAGRGIKGPEHLSLRDQLAETLGAAVGASRAVVDAGWAPHSEQVGQTGKTVAPNLYVALGISGAVQHLAGMASSKVIVAVDKNPDAPIFKKATYGIVGDIFEVVPALDAELKKVIQA